MREFLSRAGVAFTVRLVDEDDTAYDELIALGFRSVPVTLIGDRVIRGYDPDALAEALRETAPAPPSPHPPAGRTPSA
ncbi:MAG: glutaredoxin family protein [Acidobacteriota bacterium]|nr:glutaredoxin family protein [Acidobacteriota bacterium]